jgi:hypothetical protein
MQLYLFSPREKRDWVMVRSIFLAFALGESPYGMIFIQAMMLAYLSQLALSPHIYGDVPADLPFLQPNYRSSQYLLIVDVTT